MAVRILWCRNVIEGRGQVQGVAIRCEGICVVFWYMTDSCELMGVMRCRMDLLP